MELFNTYNDLIMRSIPFIVNELIEKKQINKRRLSEIFLNSIGISDECTQLTEDNYVKKNLFELNDNANSFLAKDGIYYCLYDSSEYKTEMPIVFSKHEKEYIRLMLEDPEARCFLSDDLLKKLNDALKNYDVSYITENYIQRGALINNIDETKIRERVLIICDALRNNKKIRYTYSEENNIYNGTASPYRLMYSLRERVLRLAACPDNSFEKLVFLNLDGFTNIECTDIDADPDPEKYYSAQRRKLILNVTNNKEKKSAERCMRTFSSYKRRTIYNKNSDTFTIEIDFYLFDKESIIRDILSLGSDIQVIEVRKPGMKKGEFVIDYENDIRGEVVAMLREMFNRYD